MNIFTGLVNARMAALKEERVECAVRRRNRK